MRFKTAHTNHKKIDKFYKTVNLGPHPTLKDFAPEVKIQEDRIIITLKRGRYHSQKHSHMLLSEVEDFDVDSSIYRILVGVELSRWSGHDAITNGKHIANYLISVDEKGRSHSINRVPSTVKTVEEAVEYIKPAIVKKAVEVIEIPGYYFIPIKRGSIEKYGLEATKEGEVVINNCSVKLPSKKYKPVKAKSI